MVDTLIDEMNTLPPTPQFTWASDRALSVMPAPEDHHCNDASTLPVLRTWLAKLHHTHIAGIVNLAHGYSSLTITIDPAHVDPGYLVQTIRCALQTSTPSEHIPAPQMHSIPVCYDPRYAPDLNDVAQHTQLSAAEVVHQHTIASYTVDFLGFAPGFGYLSGLPDALATPRLNTPRVRIPTGCVGIGGAHTGVYPCAMPGGWRIIGRSPICLFDSSAQHPTMLRTGDAVRFVSINADEFLRLQETPSS